MFNDRDGRDITGVIVWINQRPAKAAQSTYAAEGFLRSWRCA